VRVVIEHAIDLQQDKPARAIQVTQNFREMVEQHSRRSSPTLARALQGVFAKLHCLSMWAHLVAGEPGDAELDVEKALRLAPDDALPWTSKAELMYALKKPEEVSAAMHRAARLIQSEHDKFLMATARHLMGDYEVAKEWADRIDIAKFRDEAYRPDRAERVLARLQIELREEIELKIARTPEELTKGQVSDLFKRLLTGSVSGRPS
jgi:tetratricopeptide (TPR) repeat protein